MPGAHAHVCVGIARCLRKPSGSGRGFMRSCKTFAKRVEVKGQGGVPSLRTWSRWTTSRVEDYDFAGLRRVKLTGLSPRGVVCALSRTSALSAPAMRQARYMPMVRARCRWAGRGRGQGVGNNTHMTTEDTRSGEVAFLEYSSTSRPSNVGDELRVKNIYGKRDPPAQTTRSTPQIHTIHGSRLTAAGSHHRTAPY